MRENITKIDEKIKEKKEPKPENTVPRVIETVATPVMLPVIETVSKIKHEFDLNAKSFRIAVSSEPCPEVESVTEAVTYPDVEKPYKNLLCRSFGRYECPFGNNCKFAHDIKELIVSSCLYDENCKDVEQDADGLLINKANCKNRICQRQHSGETVENLRKRLSCVNKVYEKIPIDISYKTELCKSVGKYKCNYVNCRFAHGIDELKLMSCRFGRSCFDVHFSNGEYKNKNREHEKGRICQKCHPDETIENAIKRISG